MSKTEIVILAGIVAMVIVGGVGYCNKKTKIEAEKVELHKEEWKSFNYHIGFKPEVYLKKSDRLIIKLTTKVVPNNDQYKEMFLKNDASNYPLRCMVINGDVCEGRKVVVTSHHGVYTYIVTAGMLFEDIPQRVMTGINDSDIGSRAYLDNSREAESERE